MKKIFAIILTIAILCAFTACGKKEDMKPVVYESCTVDVSNILENKELFQNRVTSTDQQEVFKENILCLIDSIEKGDVVIQDFTISVSEEIFKSWEEANNYAESKEPGKSHLGSYHNYFLWIAQRIINNEIKWEDVCDKIYSRPTIAFIEKDAWTGSCSWKCLIDYKEIKGEACVYAAPHAKHRHKEWQAFVITPVE